MELCKLAANSRFGRAFGVLSAVLCMAPVASAAGLGARHYVQDGLVTHFDAIENTGYDEPHDGSASIWSDLKGSASITLKTEASWSGRYLDTGRKAHAVTSMPAYKRNSLTLELPMRVVKNNGQDNTFPMLFCDNGQKFYAYYWYAQTWGYLGMDSTLTIDYFMTGSFYAFSNEAKWGWGYNATQKNATSGPVTANIEHSAGDWYINSGSYLDSHYYGLRFYNRSLSGDELKANYLIDCLRFWSYAYAGGGAAENWNGLAWEKPEMLSDAAAPGTATNRYVKIANATVNVAAADNVGLAGMTLEDGAKLDLAFGAIAAVKVLYVEGVEIPHGIYTGSGSVGEQVSWLEGTGQLRVAGGLNRKIPSSMPEPVPAKTDYDIAAFYYPGWNRYVDWHRIIKNTPEREPLLGWYDDSNPEVVDWQIKWLVEHGIRTLYVDWYWDRGRRSREHWINAFQKSRFRHYMKWALMWANHNPKGSHSAQDQRAVTKFWIDNYFGSPEYLKFDGKPVVWYWAPYGVVRDVGVKGSRELFDISREMAKAAGYPDIVFVGIRWPDNDYSTNFVGHLRDCGYDMTGLYRFMGHDGRKERRYPYGEAADGNIAGWRRLKETGILPFMPNVTTGWDNTPCSANPLVIHGRNVAEFKRICVEAKKFLDETGSRRVCLGPLNEWGEGSYIEPNKEFGFSMYDAVREVFCKRPSEGWPKNVLPGDVGMGPYAFPIPPKATMWDCRGGEPDGWRALMGLSAPRKTGEGVAYTTTSRDPAVRIMFEEMDAAGIEEVRVTMRARKTSGTLQLFWSDGMCVASEAASLRQPIHADGEWHEYRFEVAKNAKWQGLVGSVRIDPGDAAGAEVEFREVRLVRAKNAAVRRTLDDAVKMNAEKMNPGTALRYVERIDGGGFRVLVYGNSIAWHGPRPEVGWTNNWGMAASAPEKDFAHLVVSGLEKRLGKRADFRIRNLATLERNFTTNVATVAEIAADAAWKPDYVVIAIGENVPGVDKSNAPAYRRFLADIARPFAKNGARIVMRSPFWQNAVKAECTAKAAADVGAVYVDAGVLGLKAENKAVGLFAHWGVANHPGDLGMRRLADLILDGFENGCSDLPAPPSSHGAKRVRPDCHRTSPSRRDAHPRAA